MQQRETATFGMWMFLLTEIMFFGGLFCSYLVYRHTYYQAFVEGSQKMNIISGGDQHGGADLQLAVDGTWGCARRRWARTS